MLAREARIYAGTVLFLGEDVQDLPGSARSFAAKYGMDYPSVGDVGDVGFQDYGLTGVPETYFIDRAGRIVYHVPGEVVPQTLEAGVRAARTG